MKIPKFITIDKESALKWMIEHLSDEDFKEELVFKLDRAQAKLQDEYTEDVLLDLFNITLIIATLQEAEEYSELIEKENSEK